MSDREIHCHFNPEKIKEVADWLAPYQKLWEGRLDAMDDLLDEMQSPPTK